MDVLADRYELAEVVGAGGMARVFVAHDRRLGRRVAVKLVREDLVADPVSRERLLREAQAAAGLQHPNVVAVHDAGEDAGRAYIVMELVEGRTLADRLAEAGRLTARETVAVGAAVLDALHAAHRRGLVHRDVKPANVLLPDAGGCKLADFGIAKALDATSAGLTATGQVLGTPRYVAPEQVAGEDATPATDLYSLGAVLYECLAGRPPFDSESALGVALAHQRDPVPPLADVAPGVPPGIAAVVERALRKAPGDRPPDAAVMASELRAADATPGIVPMPGTGSHTESRAPTDPLGEGASTGRGWLPPAGTATVQRRRGWLLAAVALAAVVLGVGLVNALGGDGDPDVGAGADVADPPPRDLGDLVADLAREPAAAGERGDDLLEGLLEVRGEEGADDRREDARDLMKDVAEWLADGELDRATGHEALGHLEPLGRPAGPAAAELGELFGEVARDLPAWGDKGEDLLKKLDDLLDEDPSARPEKAGKLRDEVDKWVEKDELDADLGGTARSVLEGVATGNG